MENPPVSDIDTNIPAPAEPQPVFVEKKALSSKKILLILLALFAFFVLLAVTVWLLFRGSVKNTNNVISSSVTPTPTVFLVTETPTITLTPTVTQEITVTPTKKVTVTPAHTAVATPTPTASPVPVFTVTNVSIQADSTCVAYSGGLGGNVFPYSHDFIFSGTITVNAAGTVTYKWQPNPGALTTTQSLVFAGPGTKAVNPYSITLTLGNWQVDSESGSNYFKVFTPNVLNSTVVNVVLNNNRSGNHPCP